MSRIFVDCFTAGLDDLTRKERRNPEAVLGVLRRTRRFSVFEATEHRDLAGLLERLTQEGRITTDDSLSYPWVRVTHIDGTPLATPPTGGEQGDQT